MSKSGGREKYVFGYGSLVNADTHDYPRLHLANLCGWRRAWRHTDLREVSFLTAIPEPDSEIWGALAPVPDADWAALDAREWAYARFDATADVTGDAPEGEAVVYAITPETQRAPSAAHPILQSYLDTVLAGYFATYGWDGVTHFIETTDGWEAPILPDRDAPRYPRAQRIDPALLEAFDARLAATVLR